MVDRIAACSERRSSVVGAAPADVGAHGFRAGGRRACSAPAARRARWCRRSPAAPASAGAAIAGRVGPAAVMRLPGAPEVAYRGDALSRRGAARSGDWRAASARRSTSTRTRRCERARRLPAGARGPRPPDLLCREGELEPGGAAVVRPPRLRLRHRLGRRARARAGGRRRPGADRLLRRRQDARRDGAARSTPASSASTSRASASSTSLSAVARGRRAHGARSACASIRTSTRGRIPTSRPACAATSSASPTTEALAAYRRAAELPGLEVVGIDCHIGSQITEIAPYLDALDRLLDLVEALEARRHRDPPPRPRRRPRHRLRRRDAARCRAT